MSDSERLNRRPNLESPFDSYFKNPWISTVLFSFRELIIVYKDKEDNKRYFLHK